MNGKPPPPTSAPIDRYTDDASNSRGSVGPSCGAAAGVPARGNGPQPPDRTATASSPPSAASLTLTRRITCRASNQDVSFAHNPMALENLAGRAIAGYRLLERVGEGGTAEVYRAEHPAGIIHHDLKPENIMFDAGTHTVKLLDFGIARDAELPPEERLTRTGFFVGTLQYVAPEALSGELVDGRADIYSLAKITYYMLTGRHPHDGRSPRELFQQLLSQQPKPLSDPAKGLTFPPALEAAVMKGLSRNPGDRQPTVTAFADDLEAGLIDVKDARRSRGLLGALKNIVGKRSE